MACCRMPFSFGKTVVELIMNPSRPAAFSFSSNPATPPESATPWTTRYSRATTRPGVVAQPGRRQMPAKRMTDSLRIVFIGCLLRGIDWRSSGPNVRAHRPPLEAGAGSESSVRGTGSPKPEKSGGGSCAAILFGDSLATVFSTLTTAGKCRLNALAPAGTVTVMKTTTTTIPMITSRISFPSDSAKQATTTRPTITVVSTATQTGKAVASLMHVAIPLKAQATLRTTPIGLATGLGSCELFSLSLMLSVMEGCRTVDSTTGLLSVY